jgi:hypothetical protein
MPAFLFMFGYESPDEWQTNARCGTDFESSEAVWIEAPDEQCAIAAGCAYAERFVGDLFRQTRISDFPGWLCANYARWIKHEPSSEWTTTQIPRIVADPMKLDNEHNPDPNVNASRIVRESTAQSTEPPSDLEAAWAAWRGHIQNVDERGMTLLRAAFEAGYDAASSAK